MLQLALTVAFYVWLFSVLVLLWLIWRASESRTASLQQTLIDAALTSAKAAETAAEAARELASHHIKQP